MSKRKPATAAKPVRPPTVRLFKGEGRKPWRFRIVGANGETVSTSQGYLTRWNRDRGARRVGLEVIPDDGDH